MINVTSTRDIIDAAVKPGVNTVIFAFSETTCAFCLPDGKKRPNHIPHDGHAMARVADKVTARSLRCVPQKCPMRRDAALYSNSTVRRMVGLMQQHSLHEVLG